MVQGGGGVGFHEVYPFVNFCFSLEISIDLSLSLSFISRLSHLFCLFICISVREVGAASWAADGAAARAAQGRARRARLARGPSGHGGEGSRRTPRGRRRRRSRGTPRGAPLPRALSRADTRRGFAIPCQVFLEFIESASIFLYYFALPVCMYLSLC